MAWRLASSLDVLRAEINSAYPGRSKISDGTIGDAAHQSQGSASDHNPWITVGGGVGVVSALDITTRGGTDPGDELAELIRRDPRTKYVIRDGRIAYGGGNWQPYNGSDPHDTHMHVSVRASAGDYDSTAPWGITDSASIGGALSEEDDFMSALSYDEQRRVLAFVDKNQGADGRTMLQVIASYFDGNTASGNPDVDSKSGVLPLLLRLLGPVELTNSAVGQLLGRPVEGSSTASADPAEVARLVVQMLGADLAAQVAPLLTVVAKDAA